MTLINIFFLLWLPLLMSHIGPSTCFFVVIATKSAQMLLRIYQFMIQNKYVTCLKPRKTFQRQLPLLLRRGTVCCFHLEISGFTMAALDLTLAPETTTVFTVTLQCRSGHVSQSVIELWSTEASLLHVRRNGRSEAVWGTMNQRSSTITPPHTL